MSQLESIKRMLVIVTKVRSNKQFSSQQELLDNVNDSMNNRGFKSISGKTLERDLKNIEEAFGLTIGFDKKYQRYTIKEDLSTPNERFEELLFNFDLLNELDSNSPLRSFVLAEHHRPPHNENLVRLLTVIRQQHPIQFTYEDYRKNCSFVVSKAHPHYLKESQGRWYLLAFNEGILKSYAIERISDLNIIGHESFKRSMKINVAELYRDCYGIWNDERMPVEDIELSYSALDGHFLKSLPLHHSQRILIDTQEEFRIALRLRITNDFVMALLSRSTSLTVIKPESLRNRLRDIYREALKRNEGMTIG